MPFLANKPRLAGALRVGLFGFAWLNVIVWLIFLFRLAIDEKFTLRFVPNIPYNYGPDPMDGSRNLFEASTYVLAIICEFFVPPLLASLAIAVAEYLPQGEPHFNKTMSKVGRLLGWQIPGRRFWFWWCGGMSLGEAIFFLGFLGAYVSWQEYYTAGQMDYYKEVWETVYMTSREKSLLRLEGWSLSFGLALYPCFWCLFWPIAHDSFLNHMLGIPWQNCIKYHRWMGHVTMWVMTLHGLGYFFLWGLEHDFWAQFSSWKDSIPYFPGTLSWLGGLALQITSIWYIRRRWFDMFYKVHIVGFIVLIIFACIHYARTWFYVLPGLMTWAVDLTFRFAQGANITTITSATLSDDKSIVTMELTLEEGLVVQPLHDYLINVPNISRWAWHPFTVARTVGNKVTLNVKKYSHFTSALFKQLERGQAIPVRVQGPIGLNHAEHPWLRYPVLVCITGGIGISPILGMLHGLVADRSGEKGEEAVKGPKRVKVVWAARHKAEFTVLDESILAAANEPWLDVQLAYTGANIERASSVGDASKIASVPTKPMAGDLTPSDTSESGGDASSDSFKKGAGGCPLKLDSLRFPWFSPLGFSLARPVQPKYANTLQKIITILLVNIGGFCGLSLASAYWAEGNAIGQFLYDGTTYFFYWKMGALLILGAFIGGLGLPVFAVHTWTAWRYYQAVRRSRRIEVAPEGSPAIEKLQSDSVFKRSDIRPAGRYASSIIGGRVGFPESGVMLDIGEQRPDIRAALQEAMAEATEFAGGADIGVFVAGPQGMVLATKKLVTQLNGGRPHGAPALHFHQETWEL